MLGLTLSPLPSPPTICLVDCARGRVRAIIAGFARRRRRSARRSRSGEGSKGVFNAMYVTAFKSTPMYFGYLIGATIVLEVGAAVCSCEPRGAPCRRQ